MKISIIVPAFNEEKLIAETLRSIGASCVSFQRLAWQTELIVCDNNSTDGTAARSREFGARVVFEPVNQIGRARNTGAAAATGDWLLFIDADSRPTPELFQDVAAEIQSGRCLAGGTTARYDEHHFLTDFGVVLWCCLSRVTKWMAGCFIFCDAQAFRRIGGFSLELYASEEIDLSQRLKKMGRETGKKIVILHRHPLLTSARKIKLYSSREIYQQFKNAILKPKQTVTNREACAYWYDGKR